MRPLDRQTLPDRVAQELLSSVLEGMFHSGQQLPSEGELATTFGVSRAVVREALGHLKALGVVDVVNGKRPVVKLVDPLPLARFFSLAVAQQENNLTPLLEVRCAIESETALLAASRRSAEDLELLGSITSQMRALADATAEFDPEQYAELDRTFHLGIARASKNLLLEQLALSIREPMKGSILVGLRVQDSPRQRRSVQASHEDIFQAVERADGAAAQMAMRSHVMRATRRILQAADSNLGPAAGTSEVTEMSSNKVSQLTE